MINWPAAQTQRWRCPCLTLPPLHILRYWRKTTADLQTAYQRAAIPTCHVYIFQPRPPPQPHPPHITPRITSPPDQDVMPHDIISSGAANLPGPVLFLSLPHTGHLSSQTGLPLGLGARGQDWVTHSGWVKQARGEARGW